MIPGESSGGLEKESSRFLPLQSKPQPTDFSTAHCKTTTTSHCKTTTSSYRHQNHHHHQPSPPQNHHHQPMIPGESSGGLENPKAPKKRAKTWVQEETRTLISLRRKIDSLINTSKSNKQLWDQISAKMREKGFDRSPTMCTDKWRNLLKEFKKYKQRPSSDPKMSYYKEIEEILRNGSKTTHFSDKVANLNHEVTLPTGPPSYTVFGYEDYNLQCTREHYRKKNIGIIIRDESELNMMRKENLRKHRAKEKGKEFQKGKEKENQPPNLNVSWDDIAIEWKRVHSTTSRGWRKVNRIFVTNNICWPWTLPMDSFSFQRFMYRRHGRA